MKIDFWRKQHRPPTEPRRLVIDWLEERFCDGDLTLEQFEAEIEEWGEAIDDPFPPDRYHHTAAITALALRQPYPHATPVPGREIPTWRLP